jgi:hypothetical protein
MELATPDRMSWIMALENYYENMDIKMAWGSVRNNFKMSISGSLRLL